MSTRDQTIWEILDTETREHWARAGGTWQDSHRHYCHCSIQ